MSALSLELLGHRGSSVLPVETLCLELQDIADYYNDAGGSVSLFIFYFLFFIYSLNACRPSTRAHYFCENILVTIAGVQLMAH